MLIAEINGVPATTHIAARLFIEEGFAATAMGLQVRTERLRPRGYPGTELADAQSEGDLMANRTDESPARPARGENRDMEHDRVRSSNDRDQQLEREGVETEHNRGYDDATKGMGDDVDPDSAEAENDRDDMLTE
jgi:hypothetical protein